MKKLILLFVACVISSNVIYASVSPDEAKKQTIAASQKEADLICKNLETELENNYTGGEYTTDFEAKHPFTAHYVLKYFQDNWKVSCYKPENTVSGKDCSCKCYEIIFFPRPKWDWQKADCPCGSEKQFTKCCGKNIQQPSPPSPSPPSPNQSLKVK